MLIFDFGGGTFDVVILEIKDGDIYVIAVGGDNHLGGEDIDANMVDYCLKKFTEQTHINFVRESEKGERALRKLTNCCERNKWRLSTTKSVTISIDGFYESRDFECEITREVFEEINKDIFFKSMNVVEELLSYAKMKASDIDDVVLVGGTTKIPKIREMLSDLFGNKPLNKDVNPDEAVAIGAAIHAAMLNGAQSQDCNKM